MSDIRFDETATCSRCRRFGAYTFDGDQLCADCYETRGSCCPEFGDDDLWDPQVRAAAGEHRASCSPVPPGAKSSGALG